jgi:hypothetical protein
MLWEVLHATSEFFFYLSFTQAKIIYYIIKRIFVCHVSPSHSLLGASTSSSLYWSASINVGLHQNFLSHMLSHKSNSRISQSYFHVYTQNEKIFWQEKNRQ